MIECLNLGKRYGSRWLFRHLDVTVQAGECLVILGDNGSGKSTLLRIMAGLLPSSEGRINLSGDPRICLGYAGLDQAVYPVLTVGEHLELSAALRGCASRVDELLEIVGLSYAASNQGRTLSTGMRGRLKIALALQANPRVVLLDEPSAGLDESGRRIVEDILSRHRDTSAFVLATNDPQERRFATHEIQLGQ